MLGSEIQRWTWSFVPLQTSQAPETSPEGYPNPHIFFPMTWEASLVTGNVPRFLSWERKSPNKEWKDFFLSRTRQWMQLIKKAGEKNVAMWFDVLLLDYDFNLNLDCIQTASLNTENPHLWRLVFLFIFLSPLSLTSLLPPPVLSKLFSRHQEKFILQLWTRFLVLSLTHRSHVLYLWFSISEMGMIIQENNVCGNFKNLRWWVL